MIQMLQKRRSRQRGFTLIELLIVVAIIAILAAILIPNFLQSRASAQVSASKSNMRNMATAVEAYQADRLGYPAESSGDPVALTPTYIGTLPTDPCAGGAKYVYSVETDFSSFRIESAAWSAACTRTGTTGIYYSPDRGLQSSP